MFKKRAVVIDVVKKKDALTPEEKTEKVSDIGAQAYVLMNNAVAGAAILIGTYMAADALRHVAIHTAAVRITPRVVVEAVAETAKK